MFTVHRSGHWRCSRSFGSSDLGVSKWRCRRAGWKYLMLQVLVLICRNRKALPSMKFELIPKWKWRNKFVHSESTIYPGQMRTSVFHLGGQSGWTGHEWMLCPWQLACLHSFPVTLCSFPYLAVMLIRFWFYSGDIKYGWWFLTKCVYTHMPTKTKPCILCRWYCNCSIVAF